MTESPPPVGYGRPPVRSRFQKGQSGNPGGRPGPKKLFKYDLEAALGKALDADEDALRQARPVKVIKSFARQPALNAVDGRPSAQRLVHSIVEREARDAAAALAEETKLQLRPRLWMKKNPDRWWTIAATISGSGSMRGSRQNRSVSCRPSRRISRILHQTPSVREILRELCEKLGYRPACEKLRLRFGEARNLRERSYLVRRPNDAKQATIVIRSAARMCTTSGSIPSVGCRTRPALDDIMVREPPGTAGEPERFHASCGETTLARRGHHTFVEGARRGRQKRDPFDSESNGRRSTRARRPRTRKPGRTRAFLFPPARKSRASDARFRTFQLCCGNRLFSWPIVALQAQSRGAMPGGVSSMRKLLFLVAPSNAKSSALAFLLCRDAVPSHSRFRKFSACAANLSITYVIKSAFRARRRPCSRPCRRCARLSKRSWKRSPDSK